MEDGEKDINLEDIDVDKEETMLNKEHSKDELWDVDEIPITTSHNQLGNLEGMFWQQNLLAPEYRTEKQKLFDLEKM